MPDFFDRGVPLGDASEERFQPSSEVPENLRVLVLSPGHSGHCSRQMPDSHETYGNYGAPWLPRKTVTGPVLERLATTLGSGESELCQRGPFPGRLFPCDQLPRADKRSAVCRYADQAPKPVKIAPIKAAIS